MEDASSFTQFIFTLPSILFFLFAKQTRRGTLGRTLCFAIPSRSSQSFGQAFMLLVDTFGDRKTKKLLTFFSFFYISLSDQSIKSIWRVHHSLLSYYSLFPPLRISKPFTLLDRCQSASASKLGVKATTHHTRNRRIRVSDMVWRSLSFQVQATTSAPTRAIGAPSMAGAGGQFQTPMPLADRCSAVP